MRACFGILTLALFFCGCSQKKKDNLYGNCVGVMLIVDVQMQHDTMAADQIVEYWILDKAFREISEARKKAGTSNVHATLLTAAKYRSADEPVFQATERLVTIAGNLHALVLSRGGHSRETYHQEAGRLVRDYNAAKVNLEGMLQAREKMRGK